MIIFLKYWNKKYFSGHIRWLLTNKKGKSVSCIKCGNIANGIVAVPALLFGTNNYPLCGKHLAEHFGKEIQCPCYLDSNLKP